MIDMISEQKEVFEIDYDYLLDDSFFSFKLFRVYLRPSSLFRLLKKQRKPITKDIASHLGKLSSICFNFNDIILYSNIIEYEINHDKKLLLKEYDFHAIINNKEKYEILEILYNYFEPEKFSKLSSIPIIIVIE